MRTHLGDFFAALREKRGLRAGQLATEIGYKDPSKGGAKIANFEQRGEAFPELLQKLIEYFQVDPEVVIELIDRDHLEYRDRVNAWLDEPMEPHVIVRLIPAVYAYHKLPAEVTTLEEAEEHTRQKLKKWPLKLVLVWTRRISVFFDPQNPQGCRLDSTPERMVHVYSCLGNRPFLWGSDLRSFVGVKLPPHARARLLKGWQPGQGKKDSKGAGDAE
jgi:transcriptional regulator with XRE-family HTH domain